jgi:hypothetical protein
MSTGKEAKTDDPNVPSGGYIDPANSLVSNGQAPAFLHKFGVKQGEWFYALKSDCRTLMRPGNDLRIRIYGCLMEFTRGYRSEFAMMRVGREDKQDKRPKFVPITPSAISAKLFTAAKAEFRASDRPLNDEEAKNWRVSGKHVRRTLESMQVQDGTLTAVTVTKFLAPNEATRKLATADLRRLMTEGLSFEQALDQKLIRPIETLSKADRKRLAGKSFLYLHTRARPATVAALMRRTEEDFTLSKASKEVHAELSQDVQLAFKFLRAFGVDDPAYAAQVIGMPNVQARLEQIRRAEESLYGAKAEGKELFRALSEEYKANHSAVQSSTALNPPGKEQTNPSVTAPHREAVETPSVAPKPNAQERVTKAPKTSNKRTPESGATEKPSTMGRNTGRVDPRQASAGASAPPTHAPTSEGRQAGSPSSPERDWASRSAPLTLDEPLVSQPRKAKTVDEPLAAEFHEALSLRFHDVGGRVPTRKQTDPILQALGANVSKFLQWLSPTEMQRRKPQHGGLLPFLLEEFEALVATAERKPIQIEESSRDMLLRLRGFDSTGRKVQNG